jgi:phage gpG-like protein
MKNFTEHINKAVKALSEFPNDVAIIAADLFDQNFERESFFGQAWKPSEYVKNKRSGGKLLQKSGRLRRSIRYQVRGKNIVFTSSVPYAEIHNQGGTINHPGGTAYFFNKAKGETIWISNRKAAGKNYPRTKKHDINMPKRQFIGNSPQLKKAIEMELDRVFKGLGF